MKQRYHDDIENKTERHLRLHQEERPVDVVQSQLIEFLLPVDETKYERKNLNAQQTHCPATRTAPFELTV
jgi:hypothetical protein